MRGLRAHLQRYPTDVPALRMLSEVAGRLRRYAEAQELLERCLKLAPSFDAARHNYAVVLNRQANPAAALAEIEQLLAKNPRNPNYLNLKAAILANLGNYSDSIEVYQRGTRGVPAAAEGLDELWPCVEDRLAIAGQRDGVPSRNRHGADARRGILEPRQPQNISLYRRATFAR